MELQADASVSIPDAPPLRGKRRPPLKGVRVQSNGTEVLIRISEEIVERFGWRDGERLGYQKSGHTLKIGVWRKRHGSASVRLILPARSRSRSVRISARELFGTRPKFESFDATHSASADELSISLSPIIHGVDK